jgi:uncharacterized membrane protein YkvA (DUF1232 family)
MNADSKASRDVNPEGIEPDSAIAPERALVPAVARLNARRVESGFWPKMRRVAARIPFAVDALAVWRCARDPATPRTAKAIMLAALAYFVLPTDAVPDILAAVGFTDDAAVFAALLAVIGKHLKPEHRAAAEADLQRLRGEEGP